MISRTRSRGGLMPTSGRLATLLYRLLQHCPGLRCRFLRFPSAQNVWIRTLYDRHRFVTRGTLGWIETGDFDKVPPDLRFFRRGRPQYSWLQIQIYRSEIRQR